MKRSEMQEIIYNTLNSACGLLEYKELSDYILESIEEAGMLPPTVNVPAFGVKDNMWEPEDD